MDVERAFALLHRGYRLVRELVTEFKENRIVEIIRMLREDLLLTTSANTRKGGLMALSAAAIALAEVAPPPPTHLSRVMFALTLTGHTMHT